MYLRSVHCSQRPQACFVRISFVYNTVTQVFSSILFSHLDHQDMTSISAIAAIAGDGNNIMIAYILEQGHVSLELSLGAINHLHYRNVDLDCRIPPCDLSRESIRSTTWLRQGNLRWMITALTLLQWFSSMTLADFEFPFLIGSTQTGRVSGIIIKYLTDQSLSSPYGSHFSGPQQRLQLQLRVLITLVIVST